MALGGKPKNNGTLLQVRIEDESHQLIKEIQLRLVPYLAASRRTQGHAVELALGIAMMVLTQLPGEDLKRVLDGEMDGDAMASEAGRLLQKGLGVKEVPGAANA